MLRCYKFLIPSNTPRPLPSNPSLSFSGCVAVVIAESEQAARERARDYAAEFGLDARWLEVATVIEIPIEKPCTLAWAMI